MGNSDITSWFDSWLKGTNNDSKPGGGPKSETSGENPPDPLYDFSFSGSTSSPYRPDLRLIPSGSGSGLKSTADGSTETGATAGTENQPPGYDGYTNTYKPVRYNDKTKKYEPVKYDTKTDQYELADSKTTYSVPAGMEPAGYDPEKKTSTPVLYNPQTKTFDPVLYDPVTKQVVPATASQTTSGNPSVAGAADTTTTGGYPAYSNGSGAYPPVNPYGMGAGGYGYPPVDPYGMGAGGGYGSGAPASADPLADYANTYRPKTEGMTPQTSSGDSSSGKQETDPTKPEGQKYDVSILANKYNLLKETEGPNKGKVTLESLDKASKDPGKKFSAKEKEVFAKLLEDREQGGDLWKKLDPDGDLTIDPKNLQTVGKELGVEVKIDGDKVTAKPEDQKVAKRRKILESIANMEDEMDGGDRHVSRKDIDKYTKDDNKDYTSEEKQVMKDLLADTDLWNELAGDDNKYGADDLGRVMDKHDAEIKKDSYVSKKR
jgi:hypothetical protein